jgi:GxxExxY protein
MPMSAANVDLSERVIAAAIAVHSALGPGLLESIYERALYIELQSIGVPVRAQIELPVSYKGHNLGMGLRLDLLVDDRLIAEIKSVARLDDVHLRQVITYLKLARLKTGLFINFNVKRLTEGIRRVSL